MNASITILITIIGAFFTLVVVAWFWQRQKQSNNIHLESSQKNLLEIIDNLRRELQETSGRERQEMRKQLDTIQGQIVQNLHFSSKTLQEQFKQSSLLIQDVTQKLTKLDETNEQVLGFSKQMQSLENILRNPKHRGILGEYFLENILSHVLQPKQYQMQYAFANGEIVDAVIFYRDQLLPIDAKFSMEKYNRLLDVQNAEEKDRLERELKNDLKIRIDETAKYIRPQENTTDFSFMFIPAEGLYYSLLTYTVGSAQLNQDLHEYAYRKHVIIVSPTSFFAYLQTVLRGLKAAQMEENIKIILKRIEDLGRHLVQYHGYFQKLGTHLGTTVNIYNSAAKELKKVDKDITKITEGKENETEFQLLKKPEEHDQTE